MSAAQNDKASSDALSEMIVRLGFKYDKAAMDEALASLEAIRVAADHAREALTRVGEFQHGGITISMVGSLMTCEIKPPEPVISGTPST